MHPLLQLLVTEPGLLADHAAGYARLLEVEIADVRASGLRRTLWLAALCGGWSVAALLAGVALMLWAVSPVVSTHAGWVLVLTPLCPLALGCAALWVLSRPRSGQAFDTIRQQFQSDLDLLREMGNP
jgi:uncharacterized membrane protein YqjE